MLEFTNLRVLHADMLKQNETRAVFSFESNEKRFSCIFLSDIFPYRLYLSAFNITPVVFEFDKNYHVISRINPEDYSEFLKYFDLQDGPDRKFIPEEFLNALNSHIPLTFKEKPNYWNVLNIVSKQRKLEESNKIFFRGWYKNTRKLVKAENLEKTRSAFGDERAEMCRKYNMSSRWTDTPEDEDLSRLNEDFGELKD